MAVIEGGVSGALQGVGTEAASPAHTAIYPVSYGAGGGYYRLGMTSGTMTAALAANAEIFQFRYVTSASRTALVYKVNLSAGMNAAATAAGTVAFRLTAARAWTAAGSGGTRAALTTNNAKLRTTMSTSEVADAGISTTAGLTAGTKTLDTADLASRTIGIGTGSLTTVPSLNLLEQTDLFNAYDGGGCPLVLAHQEGFVIRTGANAFPATATWSFSVNVYWAEVPSF